MALGMEKLLTEPAAAPAVAEFMVKTGLPGQFLAVNPATMVENQ